MSLPSGKLDLVINSSKIPNSNKSPSLSLLEIEHAAFCKSEDKLAARPLSEAVSYTHLTLPTNREV